MGFTEPHRRGVRFTLEGSAGGLGHIGGTVHPVGNGSPGILGYRLDEIAQALVLADGDGEADIHLAADGYHMSVEVNVHHVRTNIKEIDSAVAAGGVLDPPAYDDD